MRKLLAASALFALMPFAVFAQNVGPRYISVMYDLTSERVYPNSLADQITNNIVLVGLKADVRELRSMVKVKEGAEASIETHDRSELDESGTDFGYGYVMDFSEVKQQAFTCVDPGMPETYTLVMPPADSSKVGYATVYIDELPSSGFRYNISDINIAPSTYPAGEFGPPWSQSSHDAVWKCEFESVIGSTMWYYVKSTEYILETNP